MPLWDEKGKLSQSFRIEAMNEAKDFKAKHWEKFRKIEAEATKARSRITSTYEKTFEGKVGREMVRQINKAGSVSRDLTLGSSDRFNAKSMRQRAENVVEAQKQQKLASVDIKETVRKMKLFENAQTERLRETSQGARKEFNRQARDRSR